LETIFEYEHSTKYSFSGSNREALINEIEEEEFSHHELDNRLIIQDIETYLEKNKNEGLGAIHNFFIEHAKATKCNKEENINQLFNDLTHFLTVVPQLPSSEKQFVQEKVLPITINHSREEIIQLIEENAATDETAQLALYAARRMDKIDWQPFIKAALERNPVSLEGLKGKSVDEAYQLISNMPNESVYDTVRLAQPDEVWNFGRGDGIEKAILLANYSYNNFNTNNLSLKVSKHTAILMLNEKEYNFKTNKSLEKKVNFVTEKM
jgi:hypothetical protein